MVVPEVAQGFTSNCECRPLSGSVESCVFEGFTAHAALLAKLENALFLLSAVTHSPGPIGFDQIGPLPEPQAG